MFSVLCSAAQCLVILFTWALFTTCGITALLVWSDLESQRLRAAAAWAAIITIVLGSGALVLGGVVGAWALVGTIIERSAHLR